jgi:small-conductance mechanosensitive channel
MDETQGFIDIEGWRQVLLGASSEFGAKLASFLPQLVAALAILLFGWLFARLIELATGRMLRTLGLDRAAARLQVAPLLERSEIQLTTSELVGKAVFWILMLTAFLSAVETLGLTAVTNTIDRLIAYIPNLIGALLIVVLGLLAARLLGGLTRSAAVAADLESAPRLGQAVQWGAIGLVAIVALEQLGVATEILVAPVTAVVGALTLSAGLAFALGARPIITHILAGHFLRRSLPRESLVVVEGERGLVERIGATETRLRSESKSWTVPNGRLLEDVVTWV